MVVDNHDDIMRSLGRIEGTVSSVQETQDKMYSRIEDIGTRVGKLEQFKAEQRAAARSVAAVWSTSIAVVGIIADILIKKI